MTSINKKGPNRVKITYISPHSPSQNNAWETEPLSGSEWESFWSDIDNPSVEWVWIPLSVFLGGEWVSVTKGFPRQFLNNCIVTIEPVENQEDETNE